MKKIILMMLLAAYFNAFGQEHYEALLVEGKEWNYHYSNYQADIDYDFKLFVGGDTLIGGQEYKKIYKNNRSSYQFALREENHRIFIAYSGTAPRLLYDFSKSEDEAPFPDDPELKVESIDTIKAGDLLFRRFHIASNSEYGSEESWWVEGIGSCFGLDSPLQRTGPSVQFLSCSVNGMTIITKEQFFGTPIITSAGNPVQDRQESTTQGYCLLDLQGRRLSNPPSRGLYIRNGKVLVR